jgi:ferredoxin
MPYIITSECIACGACAAGCESEAITEDDTQSHIDPAICIECGTCQQNCPSNAIIFVEDQPVEKASSSQVVPESG